MKNRIKIIDASRGIAALIVVTHHFMTFFNNNVKSAVNVFIYDILNFISNLNTEAVLFFFIISGFCIGLSLKGNLPSNKKDILMYVRKRCLRIFPIYLLAILMAFLIGIYTNSVNHNSSFNFINLLGNLFFLQTPTGVKHWFSPYGDNGPLWSISYEMFFYMFFPIFSFFLLKTAIKNISIISSILFVITLGCLGLNYLNLFTPWFSFLSLFIIWYYGYLLLLIFTGKQRHDIHFIFIFTLSTVIILNKAYIPSDTLYLIAKGLIMVSLLYAFIVIIQFELSTKIFNKITQFISFLFYQIGLGSYALYAFHYVILMMCVYLKLTLIETISVLAIFIILCIKLEKFLIAITGKKLKIGQKHRLN